MWSWNTYLLYRDSAKLLVWYSLRISLLIFGHHSSWSVWMRVRKACIDKHVIHIFQRQNGEATFLLVKNLKEIIGISWRRRDALTSIWQDILLFVGVLTWKECTVISLVWSSWRSLQRRLKSFFLNFPFLSFILGDFKREVLSPNYMQSWGVTWIQKYCWTRMHLVCLRSFIMRRY